MIQLEELPRDEFASQEDYDEAVKVVGLLNKIMEYQDKGLWVFSGDQRITERYIAVPNEGDLLLGTRCYRPRIDLVTVEYPIISVWSDNHQALAGNAEGPIRCSYEWVLKNQFPNLHIIDPNNLTSFFNGE